mgnify:CR=1 FL=1
MSLFIDIVSDIIIELFVFRVVTIDMANNDQIIPIRKKKSMSETFLKQDRQKVFIRKVLLKGRKKHKNILINITKVIHVCTRLKSKLKSNLIMKIINLPLLQDFGGERNKCFYLIHLLFIHRLIV